MDNFTLTFEEKKSVTFTCSRCTESVCPEKEKKKLLLTLFTSSIKHNVTCLPRKGITSVEWFDYNDVVCSTELVEWGRTYSTPPPHWKLKQLKKTTDHKHTS